MIYTATITTASLRLRESRVVAGLLLDGVDEKGWQDAVLERNLLQIDSAVSRRRISRLLRARMEPLGRDVWQLIVEGGRDQATQAAFAGALKNSRLLGDFMDITMREQRALFAKELDHPMWNEYIAGCRGRDPDMPHWSDATVARLRSGVFSMLSEAGYLKDTRSLEMTNVFVDSQLAAILRSRNEQYVLRCMELTE